MWYGNQYKYINLNSKKDRICFGFKSFLRNSAKIMVVAWLVVGGIKLGQSMAPQKVISQREVIEVPIQEHAPVMDRIARCESNDLHKKNGQVVFMANKNGTVDIGRYQINSIWNKKATELGLDLTNEKDNEKMAYYIFTTRGTTDWKYSEACWNK